MSCSKIFSGNLPDLLYHMIKYFQNDISILHSCILVNRAWCRIVIPLLWENPFSTRTKNYDFIKFYLHNLNDDFKQKLKRYKVYKLLPSNTLFNYLFFIRYLNIWKMISSIEIWTKNVLEILKPKNINVSDFRKLIQMSLFKMLIENEVNLHTLDIDIFTISSNKSYYYDFFEIILQNPNFIQNVRNLNLSIGVSSYSNHNGIGKYMLIKDHILQIINLHHNLKTITFRTESFPLYKSLLLTKDYNCSNTLNTIILFRVNLSRLINLDKIFEQLNVLESVHMIYCSSLKSRFIQQIINLTKPFKLKSLFMELGEGLQINLLELLLQKSGYYLENFEYSKSGGFNHQLIELIKKYCENIKFLYLYYLYGFEYQIIFSVLNLIKNINQNLNYLSINLYNEYNKCSSIILRNLGQILPLKLEYLDLTLKIIVVDFKIFLENIQNTFINKLLIKNMKQVNNCDDIIACIKEYIMNDKRVRYLNFRDFRNNDLFDLKDLMKEFKLHNIRVQSYNDLYIDTYQFIK